MGACRSHLVRPDHRPHLFGFPVEIIINARPCMDFSSAVLTIEFPEMIIRTVLLRGLIRAPDSGAFETGGVESTM